MTINKSLNVGLLGLLAASSLIANSTTVAAERGDLVMSFDGARVSIAAANVPIADVVQEIAAQGNLRVVQHVMLTGAVSLQLDNVPLAAALSKILDGESYQLYQRTADGDIPGTLWIFAQGSNAISEAGVFFEAVLLYGALTEKKEAIRELRRIATTDAVAMLSLALGDDDTRVRSTAMEALSSFGSDDALAAIASVAVHADSWTRGQAVNALSSGDSESALQYLRLAFTDPDPNVRLAVIEAFAENPNNQSVAVLRTALRDEDRDVRMFAVEALEEVGSELAFVAMLDVRDDVSPEEQEAIDESLSSLTRRP